MDLRDTSSVRWARAAKFDKGEPVEAERIITFADPLQMMQCLTAERVRLCQAARTKQLSISALAEELGRNHGSVARDGNKLKQFGWLQERVNPTHGVVQIVEPVAAKFDLRAAL